MLAPILTTALFAAALPAHATNWDWETEEYYRDWRTATLTWASEIHEDTPSPLILLATTTPPPRAMWCLDDAPPTQADLDAFSALLDDWLAEYLDIPDEDPIPPIHHTFPAEC